MSKLGIYITNEQQAKDTMDMCKVLRQVIPDFDVVVPLPRGGFLPASIIANKFGRPMATPDMLLKSKFWWTTSEAVKEARANTAETFDMTLEMQSNIRILLVDDVSYNWYGLLHRTKEMLLQHFPKATVYKCAVYCFERTKRNLDFYCKEINIEHYFEKDLLIRKRGTAPMICDMDEVLCDSQACKVCNEDALYEKAVREAKPYMIPHWKIDIILTGRLEMYRRETEEWLQKHGVRYDKLIMKPNGSRSGPHGTWKANTLFDMHLPDGTIMLESNFNEALEIFNRTGIQVICTDTNQLLGAADLAYNYHPAFLECGFKNEEHPQIVVITKKVDPDGKPHRGNWLFP